MRLNDTKSIVQCILEIWKSGEKIIDFLISRQTIKQCVDSQASDFHMFDFSVSLTNTGNDLTGHTIISFRTRLDTRQYLLVSAFCKF